MMHALAVERMAAAGPIPITQAMLDQRMVAGFENIHAVETPFIVGINPYTKVDTSSNIAGLMAVELA